MRSNTKEKPLQAEEIKKKKSYDFHCKKIQETYRHSTNNSDI